MKRLGLGLRATENKGCCWPALLETHLLTELLGEYKMNNHEEELLLDDYYTVGVIFSSDATSKPYTYKVDNSLDLQVDDLVVVVANDQYKLVKVVKRHETNQVDFASNYVYKYVIDKVDFTRYDELKERSKKIRQTLDESKRRTLKTTLVTQFKEGLDEEGKKMLGKWL